MTENIKGGQKYNLFLGEYLSKILETPTTQKILKELFSGKDKDYIILNNDLSLQESIQNLLNNVIYDRRTALEKLNSTFFSKAKLNSTYYRQLLESKMFASFITTNYDYILEDFFFEFIKKNTPFLISNDDSAKLPFFKIYGDIKSEAHSVISSQDVKRIKQLSFYNEFWSRIKETMKKNPTIFLGTNFLDTTFTGILDHILKDIKGEYKQLYIYVNSEVEKDINNVHIDEYLKKYSIKKIEGDFENFLQVINGKLQDTKESDASLEYA